MSRNKKFDLRSGAAHARGYCLGHGVCEVVYTGPVTKVTFSALKAGVLRETQGVGAMVLRMEHAAVLLDEAAQSDVAPYAGDMPPAAVVSCADRFAYWNEYARRLAGLGVMRAVFLPDHLELARLWARRHVAVRL
jgi:hypothetical protein